MITIPRSEGTVRYAVLGLGWIAQVAVLPAFKNAQRNCRLAALVSGDQKKLKKLGRKYNVDRLYTYDEYEQCLSSGEIDAVYIALPNDMHRDYTVRAAERGVHVLCEKPLAVTSQECIDMIDACRAHNVKLMTSYRLHFEPANMKAVDLVRSGTLGEVSVFSSVFTMKIEDDGNIRVKPEKGGGTVYDIGIYCINAARYLFQDEPEEVFAFSAYRNGSASGGVDQTTTAILRFPGDRLASFTSSFGVVDVSSYRILGTKGELCVEPAYQFQGSLRHELSVGGRMKRERFRERDQFAPVLMYFADCVLSGADPEPSGEEGLADVRIINAVYQSAREGRPVRMDEIKGAPLAQPSRRPGLEQAMSISKPRVPRLVGARGPG